MTKYRCKCAQCRAARALDVLRGLPSMPDDGRDALDAIEAALNELEQDGFARWDSMNDVATAWREALRVTNDALKSVPSDLMETARWRPVTEKPTVTAQYQVVLQSGNRRPTADHRAYYEDTGWVGPDVIFWRPIPPLPPAPATQEPMP